jgi:undecaprenyl-diphosphatase
METIIQLDKIWFLFVNNTLSNPFFDWLCPLLRNQKTWYLFYVAIIYFFYKNYKNNTWKILLVIALMIVVSDQFSANLVKKTFMRIRPCSEPSLHGMVKHLIASCNGYSFISAHATNHFALALFFIFYFKHYGKWVIFIALFWAFSIAFSQVYVGVHYPLDVIVGAMVGSLFGTAFARYSLKFIKLSNFKNTLNL